MQSVFVLLGLVLLLGSIPASARAQKPVGSHSLLYGYQRRDVKAPSATPFIVTLCYGEKRTDTMVHGRFVEVAALHNPEFALFKGADLPPHGGTWYGIWGKQQRHYKGHQYFGTAQGLGITTLGFLPFPAFVSKRFIGYELGAIFTQFTGTLAVAGNVNVSLSLGAGLRF